MKLTKSFPRSSGSSLFLLLFPSFIAALPQVLAERAVETNPSVNLDDVCPGYIVQKDNVKSTSTGLVAKLKLAEGSGKNCDDVYGIDVKELKLEVSYEDVGRLHVKITDPNNARYEVPEDVFPRPGVSTSNVKKSDLIFTHTVAPKPFSFTITRRSNNEVLFTTTGSQLIFKPQYLRVKTDLPANANIYGLGEHSETFRLPEDITRTLWSRDSYGVPNDSNLYGVHPIYLEQRYQSPGKGRAHGVFLLNSNGMDIKIAQEALKTTLEYNIIGGVIDFYFLSGGKDGSGKEVGKQYAALTGLPTMTPYWNLGLHQCRWGYRDWIEVAEVIANYSQAGIPLETMWTDIDYMDERKIFTLDPANFPLSKVREIVKYLHDRGMRYIMMVDPAVAYRPYETFDRGVENGVFMMDDDNEIYEAVVWPGITAYPDWFAPKTTEWWVDEFRRFFNPETGVDIDGVWIDMNEPTNFCDYPCVDPAQTAKDRGMPPPPPPKRDPPRPIPGFPSTYQRTKRSDLLIGERKEGRSPVGKGIFTRQDDETVDPALNLTHPPYAIRNDWPNGISDRTADTDLIHANGLTEYDTHNLYGTMMSITSRTAMLARRPNLRPVVVTRSTFAGAGSKVFKWLGDNVSNWDHYRNQIAHMLNFASIYGMPVVGSDVCGFGGNATITLCARWAVLGAFNPFYRNHNVLDSTVPQEFYRYPLLAKAAKSAIDIRYRLLDYLYTALFEQSSSGTPNAILPLFFEFPNEKGLEKIEYQFMYGTSIMVAPVVNPADSEENDDDVQAKSVNVQFPQHAGGWYDFYTHALVSQRGGTTKTYSNINFHEIPLFIKGGSVVPLRVESAMTTVELRKKGFEVIVAPGGGDVAQGELYLDDGVSLEQDGEEPLRVRYEYKKGKFAAKIVSGKQGGKEWKGVNLEKVVVAGWKGKKVKEVRVNGKKVSKEAYEVDEENGVVTVMLEGVNVGEGVEVRVK